MNRDDMLRRIESERHQWDLIIIGGGATGLGVAIDAASRGYATLLLEQSDFAKGTSSRSTKLVHGGVRYLQQGNVSLVLEALKERGLLRRNAPHLVHNLPFVVPNYDWWEGPFYGIGLRLYDLLAGKHGFGPSKNISLEKTAVLHPHHRNRRTARRRHLLRRTVRRRAPGDQHGPDGGGPGGHRVQLYGGRRV